MLVGGRGTGKSTVIESLRYVLALDPLGDDARKAHDGVIRHVLRSRTKVSLLVRSHKPSLRCYTIERTIPNPPVVKDESGAVLRGRPLSCFGSTHEKPPRERRLTRRAGGLPHPERCPACSGAPPHQKLEPDIQRPILDSRALHAAQQQPG